jgi:hypothetical protein
MAYKMKQKIPSGLLRKSFVLKMRQGRKEHNKMKLLMLQALQLRMSLALLKMLPQKYG